MIDDWPGYPTDQEYWEKEMSDMENITRVREGTMDQYLRQKKNLGEKKFFRILRKKIRFKGYRRWSEILRLPSYYDRGYSEIRVAGGMVINEAIIENVVRQHFNCYPEDVPVEEEKSGIPQIE